MKIAIMLAKLAQLGWVAMEKKLNIFSGQMHKIFDYFSKWLSEFFVVNILELFGIIVSVIFILAA